MAGYSGGLFFGTKKNNLYISRTMGGIYMDADNARTFTIRAPDIYFIPTGIGRLMGTWQGTVSSSTTSDSRYKNSITELSSAYSILFDNLIPKRFKYNDGTSNRFHTGFIAQDVNEAIKTSGLTTQDFAATVLFNKGEENE